MQTIVIGHRNPDMDSICSALAYARLKAALGWYDVVAARAGNLNARIQFALGKFNTEPPTFLSDVTPQVRDVMTREVVRVRGDDTISQALHSIEQRRLRGLPVVDEENRCLGLLSAIEIGHQLFPPLPELGATRTVRAFLHDIVRTFDGEVVAGDARDEVERDHILMVAAMKAESFVERLRRQGAANVVLFVGDRDDIQAVAIDEGVRALVLTSGVEVVPAIARRASAAGVTLVRSRLDTATTVLLARGAVRAGRLIEGEYAHFAPEVPLEAARARAAASADSIFPVLDDGGRMVGVVTKSDFLKSVPRQLILVDHNELSQAVRGADKLPIIEVIDHHRLGGFSTDQPIHFWNNPVGSTCTIVAMLYQQNGVELPRNTAGLLMAGLISDTLNLTSPTATPVDRTVMTRLEKIAGIDAATLASEIFAVGSPLLTLDAKDVVTSDCKEYEEAGVRFSVAQIEELGFRTFRAKYEELAVALDEFCRREKLFFSALLVTDINTQNSVLLVSGAEEFRQQIDYPSAGHGLWRLDGVVSRKKQLLPYLLQRLQETKVGGA